MWTLTVPFPDIGIRESDNLNPPLSSWAKRKTCGCSFSSTRTIIPGAHLHRPQSYRASAKVG